MAGWPQYVRALRRAHGLKQAALADMVGVTQQMVSAWERGLSKPGPQMRRRLIELMRRERSLEDELLLNLVRRSAAMQVVGPGAFVIETGTLPLTWLGLPREEVVNRPWRDRFGPHFARTIDLIDQSGIYDGLIASVTYVNKLVWEGKTFEFVAFSTPLLIDRGQRVRCVVYHRFMTPEEFRRNPPVKAAGQAAAGRG